MGRNQRRRARSAGEAQGMGKEVGLEQPYGSLEVGKKDIKTCMERSERDEVQTYRGMNTEGQRGLIS